MKKNVLALLTVSFLSLSLVALNSSPIHQVRADGMAQQNIVTPSPDTPPKNSSKFIFPTRGQIVQGYHGGHLGIDIDNLAGTPIWAVQDGTVIKIVERCADQDRYCGAGYGNLVLLDHGNGFQTLYAHLQSVTVKVGDKVTQGQVIGTMGRSGNVYGSTGIHLHFEVRENGKKMPPQNYF